MNFEDWIVRDCLYVEPEFCSQYIRVIDGKVCVIETNTSHAAEGLLKDLAKWGLKPSDIEIIIATHIHLDHAAGAGTLMKYCPNAKLYLHPRAARHAIDPTKLIASARQVYREKFDELYGEILPCPADRVLEVADGEKLEWRGIQFLFQHTRGHANHHICIQDVEHKTLFSGDSFGVSYPFATSGGRFVLPSTSPTDFDYEQAVATVQWIKGLAPLRVGLTHFGFVTEIDALSKQMLFQLDLSKQLLQEIKGRLAAGEDGSKVKDEAKQCAEENLLKALKEFGIVLNGRGIQAYRFDLEINIQGLIFAAGRT